MQSQTCSDLLQDAVFGLYMNGYVPALISNASKEVRHEVKNLHISPHTHTCPTLSCSDEYIRHAI